MDVRLIEAERSRMRGMVKRPRSREPLDHSEMLVALDEGRPVAEVARRHRVDVERVEGRIAALAARRLAFLTEPEAGRPRGRRDDEKSGGASPGPVRGGPGVPGRGPAGHPALGRLSRRHDRGFR